MNLNGLLESTGVYAEAKDRLEELKKQRRIIEKRMENAPGGSIVYKFHKRSVQYYFRENGGEKSRTYIRKSENKKIKTYLQKKYDAKVLIILTKEIEDLENLSNLYNSQQEKLKNLYSELPDEVKKNVVPIDISDEEYAKEWLKIPFQGKAVPEGKDDLRTDNGEIVRSKTEIRIANALKKSGIPYKYECPLSLKGGVIIHPDFTVLSPSKRKIYYWEHRGMMDDREYAKNAVVRNKEYVKNGIFLGDNLIYTEETLNAQLSTFEIEQIIKHYFL